MLEIKNLTYQVDESSEEKSIIKGIDLKIDDGKFVVITGPNGGGKSTLAKLIMGICPASSGSIIYDGTDITNMSITDRANLGISFAFQQPVHFMGIRVYDLLRLASGTNINMATACEYLSKVGLCAKDYIYREVNGSLSGGELKRIEIATVLARGTKLIIFDEPEAGIDLWSFQNLIKVFENIRATINGTVIIISHQERIIDIADEIVVIDSGLVKMHGPKDEILPQIMGTSFAAQPACGKLTEKEEH